MIASFSQWAKNLSLAILVVSLLEMLLPNNKTKKYVKMAMGLYILFNIISPFLVDNISINLEQIIEENASKGTSQVSSQEIIDQTSMTKRLKQICEEELEKDIKKKLEEKGYNVTECKVDANLSEKENETEIKSIQITVEKQEQTAKQEDVEDKIVSEIQKIKKVQIGQNGTEEKQEGSENNNISNTEKKEIQKFLSEEYGVKEKCLRIN